MSSQLHPVPSQSESNSTTMQQALRVDTTREMPTTVMTLANKLHIHLSVEGVIEQFYRYTYKALNYSGLIYQLPKMKDGISHGVMGRYSCSYELKRNDRNLGTIDFYSGQVIDEPQLVEIEKYLCGLINPLLNALIYRDAVHNSYLDSLTGAKNRAAFDLEFEREIELAHRYDHPLSIIVMDIDHFKNINDSFGHSYGDDVLKRVIKKTEDLKRSCDTVYRYGGEEFVIMAGHTDLDGARRLAERIRMEIYEEIERDSKSLTLSASFGVAQLRAEESRSELFDRADKALYAAKNNGRNQVTA